MRLAQLSSDTILDFLIVVLGRFEEPSSEETSVLQCLPLASESTEFTPVHPPAHPPSWASHPSRDETAPCRLESFHSSGNEGSS